MKIVISSYSTGDLYRADLRDLPGSPPIGTGKTKEEAVASLFWRILHPDDRNNWAKYIDFDDFEIMSEEEWKNENN